MLAKSGTIMFSVILARSVSAGPPCGTNPYDCALNLLGEHELSAAISTLQAALKTDSHSLKILNLLGISLLEAGRTKEAEVEFRQAVAIEPRFYPARKNLAIAEFTLGQFDTAKANLQKVIAQKSGDSVSLLYLGELSYRSGNWHQASANFEKSGASLFSIPAFAVHYGDCLIRSGRLTEAASVLRQVPENAADAQFAAGLLLAKAGSYADAAHCFHQARRGYANPYAAAYNEALTELEAGLYQGVIDTVEGLLRDGQVKGELLNLEAAAYRKLNRVREAYDTLRRAAQLSPYEEQNYIDLADLCLDYDNYDLGREIINIGLKSIPDSERLYLHRGVLDAMRANLSQAEADFEFAAQLAPQAALPRAALGLTWMAMGDIPKATRTLRECDKSNHSDFAISFLLGEALIRQGAGAGSAAETEAITAFEKALIFNPGYAPARAELGKILLRRGDEARGIAELEKSLDQDPQERTAAYQLAQVYRKHGQQQRASELMARVRNLNAKDRDQDLKRAMVLIVRQTGNTGGATPKLNPSSEQLR